MPKYVKISPFARVGGQIGVTTRINSSKVSGAYVHGEMFRGIEKLLLKRDPRDAPVVTSRTSGKSHFIHRHVSLRNIENAAGWIFPMPQAFDAYSNNQIKFEDGEQPGSGTNTNDLWLGDGTTGRTFQRTTSPSGTTIPGAAQMARNIVQLINYIYSHITHLVLLAGPDYKKLVNDYMQSAYSGGNGGNPGANPHIRSSEVSNRYFFDNIYNEAVVAQRILNEALGFIGGKSPHQMSAVPGGFSRSFTGPMSTTGTDMGAIKSILTKSIAINGKDPSIETNYRWPLLDLSGSPPLDQKRTLSVTTDWFGKRFLAFLEAMEYALTQIGADTWGYGPNNFVCAGLCDIVRFQSSGSGNTPVFTGDQYFRAGVLIDSTGTFTRYKLDPTQSSNSGYWMTIYEDITSGKYPTPDLVTDKPQCSGYPGETETQPLVAIHDSDRYIYSWSKSARVKDGAGNLYAVESGPLARLVVNGVDPDLNVSKDRGNLFTSAWKSSTANRLWARIQDLMLLIDILIGSNYSGENGSGYLKDVNNGCLLAELDKAWTTNGFPLSPGVAISGSDMVEKTPPKGAWQNLNSAAGCAYLDGPQGATCHFCEMENGKLSQYQILGGSTWNACGRDEANTLGPVEWSLVGMTKVTNVNLNENTGGNWGVSLNPPVCERTLIIKYELQEGSHNWKEYTAIDVPKHITDGNPGSEEGKIVGEALEATSKVDYTTGALSLDFKQHSAHGYDYMRNVKVEHYGYASNGVPAPAVWKDYNYVTGYEGYSNSGDASNNYPNPINIMRTVRSFDPCNNCGTH